MQVPNPWCSLSRTAVPRSPSGKWMRVILQLPPPTSMLLRSASRVCRRSPPMRSLVVGQRLLATSAGSEDASGVYFTTRDQIRGREVLEEFGMVTAVAVRSKSVVSDMYVALAGLVGGEAASYTSLINETVAEAVHRVQYAAKSLGATAVVNVRFDTNTTMNRLVFGMHCSVVCYGTAVRCRPMKDAAGNVKAPTLSSADGITKL